MANMRPAAKVRKISRFIHGYRMNIRRIDIAGFFLGKLCRPFRFQIIQQFDFIGLSHALEKLNRFVDRHFLPFKGRILFKDILHRISDLFDILRRKSASIVDIVIKPVFDHRADAEFR